MDSYEANYVYGLYDHPLVMNFANAHHPGGGFLSGASAQEESLCRCSSLFTSLVSEQAREMYDYNNDEPDAFDSDYIMISRYVNVFRWANGDLMDDNFTTSVLTIPAPNLNGRAQNVSKEQLKMVMKQKIRNFMRVSARQLYDTLILGAWGCGAFGHDAKYVAQYFKEVIEEEKYYQLFKQIIFAVYDKTADQYNYKSFLEAFGEHGIWKDEGTEKAIVTVTFRNNTKDEDGNIIVCEETHTDTKEELQDLLNQYLVDNRVAKIEIIK